MPTVIVKDHVQDPVSFLSYLRGTYEVDDVVSYRLTSTFPEQVVLAEDLQDASKDELVQTANEAGVEVDPDDTKGDVAKKLRSSAKK